MRTSLYLVGFAAASIMGAGAVGFGCSSSSSPAAAVDSGTPEASPEEAGGEDGGADAEMMMEAAACTPAPVNISTFDGGSVWTCTQTACASTMGGLTACGADCTCNAAVFSALQCVASDGGSTTACFTNALTPVISDMAVLTFATCLQSAPVSMCAGLPVGDGGKEGGGGDGGGGDGGGGDAGITDAGGGG
jgi:hypothetical protein